LTKIKRKSPRLHSVKRHSRKLKSGRATQVKQFTRGSGKTSTKTKKKVEKYEYWVHGESLAYHGGKIFNGPYKTRDEALKHARFEDRIIRHRKNWMPPEED